MLPSTARDRRAGATASFQLTAVEIVDLATLRFDGRFDTIANGLALSATHLAGLPTGAATRRRTREEAFLLLHSASYKTKRLVF